MDTQTNRKEILSLEDLLIILARASKRAGIDSMSVAKIERVIKTLGQEGTDKPIPVIRFEGEFSPPLEIAIMQLQDRVFSTDAYGHSVRIVGNAPINRILMRFSELKQRAVHAYAERFVALMREPDPHLDP